MFQLAVEEEAVDDGVGRSGLTYLEIIKDKSDIIKTYAYLIRLKP